jgi:hypothetical protein
MEKKIERVPYISKWYKEEQKDELLNFAFDEQNAGSDWDVDKFSLYDKNLYTYSTNTTNGLWTTGYSKPTVQLKFVCHLTQWDIDDLKTRLQLAMQHNSLIIDGKYNNGNIIKKDDINRIIKLVNTRMQDVIDYLDNNNDIREKCQKDQLVRLEEQSKPKKSYEGTLGEHWKELMDLFDIKSKYGINSIKDIDENCLIAFQDDWGSTNKLHSVFNKLGLDFIKDFIKACEKCED